MLYRHLKNVSGHLLKKFAGNLLNCLASKGVAVDHVRAFLSHMSDTTHLDYLESFVPAAILLAGHGPDWQNHHRIGRDVQVPDELMEAVCPGLAHLMEAYPAKLHLFKHLMVVMIQVMNTAAAEATVGTNVCFMHACTIQCMHEANHAVHAWLQVIQTGILCKKQCWMLLSHVKPWSHVP